MHWWEHPNCVAPPTWNPIFSQFGPLYYLQCAFWTLCPAGCQTLAAQQDTQANCSGRNWIGGGGGIPASSRITWAKTQPKAKEGPKCAQDLWLMVLCFCGCAGIGGWGGGVWPTTWELWSHQIQSNWLPFFVCQRRQQAALTYNAILIFY